MGEPRKTTKPSAAAVSKLNRDEKIRQEILAAKNSGVNPPWQIASGERFTVAKTERLTPPSPKLVAGGTLYHSLAEQDSDFVYWGASEGPFNLSSILANKLSKLDQSVMLQNLRIMLNRLEVSDSANLRQTLSENINQMFALGVIRTQVRALSAKLDEIKFSSKRKYINVRGIDGGGTDD